MRKTGVLVILALLIIMPAAFSSTGTHVGDYVQFSNLRGNSFNEYSMTMPAYFLGTHSGIGDSCSGTDCNRYLVSGVHVFNITNGTTLLATMSLDGVVLVTTKADQQTFNNGIVMMWGDATFTPVDPSFNYSGDYKIVLEYWNPNFTALALLKNTGSDLNVDQFRVNMTKIMSNNEIIVFGEHHPSLLKVETGTDYPVNITGWGSMHFFNDYETLSASAGTANPELTNYSITIGLINATNSTDRFVIDGWGKVWRNTSNGVYGRTIYGRVVEDYPIIDNDDDGYDSTVDCDDNNASVYQMLTGYKDLDSDLYTITAPEDLCSGETLPDGYVSLPSAQEDCNDDPLTGSSINPGAVEICDNGIDEDCEGNLDNGCGSVNGYVFETSGWSFLGGVPVTLTDYANQTFTTSSDGSGYFDVMVPVGTYAVSALYACYIYPSVLYPFLALDPIQVNFGETNGDNYVYMDYIGCPS